MHTHEFIVAPGVEDRIDKFLADALKSESRSKIQSLIAGGNVMVDSTLVLKCNQHVSSGQKVLIYLIDAQPLQIHAVDLDFEVIYIDEDTIVINKPAGVVVHPGAGKETNSLVSFALWNWPEIKSVGQPERPGVVHRLDKDTSGVILMARSQKAYDWYISQFKSHKVKKVYITLVDGHPQTTEGRIETTILRDPTHRQRMAIGKGGQGRKAITEYHQIEKFAEHELLRVNPITGRTHQIRVHMAFLGTPVVGDKIYGRKNASLPIKRFFLHAQEITICLPNMDNVTTFTSSMPEDLEKILNDLRT
jgi:23S rRNA pseudouridine1911/1915/1917 synthase